MAVTIGIDGIEQVTGRDELRMTHGAGPRAVKLIARHIAALQDLQRRDQLLSGIVGALRIGIGKRRQCAGHIMQLLVLGQYRAVIRFHRPDG